MATVYKTCIYGPYLGRTVEVTKVFEGEDDDALIYMQSLRDKINPLSIRLTDPDDGPYDFRYRTPTAIIEISVDLDGTEYYDPNTGDIYTH